MGPFDCISMLAKLSSAANTVADAAAKKANIAEAHMDKKVQGERIKSIKKDFGVATFDLVAANDWPAVQHRFAEDTKQIEYSLKRIESADQVIACGGDRSLAQACESNGIQ